MGTHPTGKLCRYLLIGTALGSFCNPAYGQDAAPEDDQDEDTIVVTGSRVIVDGSQAPTPVTVISAEQLSLTAPSTLSDGLNQLPVFSNSFVGASTGPGVVSNAGGAYLNARSLGANRNLVLLDGKRIVPSSVSGSVAGATDINVVPQGLLKRVDVVTGGASAAYGSDAISSVVNFILDTGFTGVKLNIQGGASDRNDNRSVKGSVTFGTPFADGRGHLLASADYYNNSGVTDYLNRKWARQGYAVIQTTNPSPQTSTANPTRIIARDVRFSDRSFGGLVTSGPLAGQQFVGNGVLIPFPLGTNITASTMSGGSSDPDLGPLLSGVPALERSSFFGRASFEVVPAWTFYAEGLLANARTDYAGDFSTFSGAQALRINADNAYLNPAYRAALGSVSSFTINRINVDFGQREESSDNRTWRVVGGVEGRAGPFNIQANYVHGKSRQTLVDGRNVIVANLRRAIDAVVAPAGNLAGVPAGTIVCRDLLSTTSATRDAAAGCQPLNVLGNDVAGGFGLSYVLGDNIQVQHIEQDVAEVSVDGNLFSTWAGPVAVGAGASYRKENVIASADPIGTARGFEGSNLGGLAGSYSVKEVYGEVLVPLAADWAFARSLDLSAALRYADYSTSGGVTSWKAGITYQPFDGLRLRAARSRDVRAANLNELFSGEIAVRPPITDPFRGNERRSGALTINSGNPNLDVEKGDTLTAGFVIEPGGIPGLRFSADYYRIDLKNAIGTLGGGQIVAQCFAGNQSLCPLISRAAPSGGFAVGPIVSVANQLLNVGSAKIRGLDFELGYSAPLSDIFPNAAGSVSVRLLANHLLKQQTSVVGATSINDQAGRIGGTVPSGFGGTPEWSGTLNLRYDSDRWGLNVQQRYLGSGIIDNTVDKDGNPVPANSPVNANLTGNGLVPNTIGAVFYTDLTALFHFGDDREKDFFLTINNLFDRDPPIIPQLFTTGTIATNAQIYDTIGRTYTAGFRLRF